MIDEAGKLWVIDFGIARVLDLPSLTGTANFFGVFTPGYGAPEQIRNMKAEINSRADLFSIGVVMHEMMIGTNLYLNGAKDAMDVLRRMLNADLPAPTHSKDVNGELSLFVSNMASRFPIAVHKTRRKRANGTPTFANKSACRGETMELSR